MSDAIGTVDVYNTNAIGNQPARDFFQDLVSNIALLARASGERPGRYFNMTVAQYFTVGFVPEAYGGTPAVLTVPQGSTDSIVGTNAGHNVPGIYAAGGLGSAYLSGDNFNVNMAHELIHYVSGLDDDKLQDKDHLNTGGKDVSAWLKDGCKGP